MSAGSNPRIDTAITMIEKIKDFLVQGVGECCPFETTVQEICRITEPWGFLASREDSAVAAGGGAE